MKILYFCQKKNAGWEGIVYEENGKSFVTNGLATWELNAKRREDLKTVQCIDLDKLALYAERTCMMHSAIIMQAINAARDFSCPTAS